MTLVRFRNDAVAMGQVRQLLSYAVGAVTDEKLNRIFEHVYSATDTCLYVSMSGTTVLGVVGIRRSTSEAKILHIAVHE